MYYSIRLDNVGQFQVTTTYDGDVEMVWTSFEDLILKIKSMSNRVLSEATNPEAFEAMRQHERLKNFFIRIKDAEPENYETILHSLQKQDSELYEFIKGV